MMPTMTLDAPEAPPREADALRDGLDPFFRIAAPLLALGNAGAVLLVCAARWAAPMSYRAEKLAVGAYVVASAAAAWAGWLSRRIRPQVFLLNVGQALLIAALLGTDVLLTHVPSLLPKVLVDFEPQLNPGLRQTREALLEYLPFSPWVRFKPGITVRTVGDRGGEFTYTWTTDRFGFKNDEALAARTDVAAVAIGDSFVEATGVPADATWAAVLSQRGWPTYSLGVQGFSPQQMVGALDRFGRRFHPQAVLIGYTSGFEARAPRFADAQAFGARLNDPAVQQALQPQYLQERRPSEVAHWKVLNAALELGKSRIRHLVRAARTRCPAASPSIFAPYCTEVQDGARVPFDPAGEPWRLTAASLDEAARIAREMGATPIILFFRTRAFLYYPRLMGTPAPAGHFERRTLDALRAWAAAQGIAVIDTEPVLARYLDEMPDSADASALPYFARDGHLNAVGQRLVAEAVAGALARGAHAP